jgi:hypothetical protein
LLFAEPDAALGEWRGRLHYSLLRAERERDELRKTLGRDDLRAVTRARLELNARALEDHGRRLGALLAPLSIGGHSASVETHLALRTRLPIDQGLTTYYPNLHRDWSWGDEENAASLEIVDGALGDGAAGRVLVLGAGSGRLAYDVHRRWTPGITVALDFNPLLMIVAQSVARGERIGLYEFPLAPRTAADVAVLRELAAPEPAPAGLSLRTRRRASAALRARLVRHRRYAVAGRYPARAVRSDVRADQHAARTRRPLAQLRLVELPRPRRGVALQRRRVCRRDRGERFRCTAGRRKGDTLSMLAREPSWAARACRRMARRQDRERQEGAASRGAARLARAGRRSGAPARTVPRSGRL